MSVTIKDNLADNTKRDCIIYAGTLEFEKLSFAKGAGGDGEPEALVAAFANSPNFTATKVADGNKTRSSIEHGVHTRNRRNGHISRIQRSA